MIYLDTSTKSLQVVCATNVSTTQADVVVHYFDVPKREKKDFSHYLGASFVTTTSNSTHITALPAPQANVTRCIEALSVYNADVSTAPLRFLVKIDDATVKKTLINQALITTETLAYNHGAGWQIL